MENDYDGPHLDAEGRVTKEFMFALLPYFENQKKLHKKYAYQVKNFLLSNFLMKIIEFHLDCSTNFNTTQIITIIN